jgi:hypothetical protein
MPEQPQMPWKSRHQETFSEWLAKVPKPKPKVLPRELWKRTSSFSEWLSNQGQKPPRDEL